MVKTSFYRLNFLEPQSVTLYLYLTDSLLLLHSKHECIVIHAHTCFYLRLYLFFSFFSTWLASLLPPCSLSGATGQPGTDWGWGFRVCGREKIFLSQHRAGKQEEEEKRHSLTSSHQQRRRKRKSFLPFFRVKDFPLISLLSRSSEVLSSASLLHRTFPSPNASSLSPNLYGNQSLLIPVTYCFWLIIPQPDHLIMTHD